MKNNKGITLVALIITVIVMVALAGIALQSIMSEDGLLRNLGKSIDKYNLAEINEKIEIINSEIRIAKQIDPDYQIDIVAKNLEVLGEESGNDVYELIVGEDELVVLIIKDPNEEGISDDVKEAREEAIENQTIKSGYTPIYTVEQLKLVGQGGTYEVVTSAGVSKGTYPFELDTNYILMDNIVLDSAEAWNCIAISDPFTGIFDGNYYTISNLTLNSSTTTSSYYGLFQATSGATIKNLNMDNAKVESAARAGTSTLVGLAENTTIKNCKVTGDVSNNSTYIGFITSRANNSKILDCEVDATLNLTTSGNGGITAYPNNTTIDNCKVNIDASACTGDNIGGIAAYPTNGTTISNCVVTGEILGGQYVGGIAGSSYININDCISFAKVTANANTVGGIAGLSYGDVKNCYSIGDISGVDEVGGIAGKQGGTIIENCYSTGNITGTTYVAGIAGRSLESNFLNCYSKGTITGTSSTAGIVGYISSGVVKMEKCYSVATVPTTGSNIGKLVGEWYAPNVVSSYYCTEVEGLNGSLGVGLTKAQMKQASSYEGWTFDSNPWAIDEGTTLPYLVNLSDYKPTI